MNRWRSFGFGLALSAISTSAFAAPLFAPPPPAKPHLKAYADWAALWWTWAVTTPAPVNPVVDQTGVHCAEAQPVPGVFFLAGSFETATFTRTCTVPVGTAFLIPMLNDAYFVQQTDPPEQRTEAFARSQVHCVEQNPQLLLSVDGVPLANPVGTLEHSSVFSVNLPPDNVFGAPPQLLSPSVDEGYYGFVEPLTPGSHQIHITSSSGCGVTEDVTYNLMVQGTVGTPRTCSGSQTLNLNNADIQTNGVALTVTGNCNVTINNSVLWGGTAGIVIRDQGHVIVQNSVIGGGFAVQANGHGHGELRNSAVISPLSVTEFAVVSDSGGNVPF